jgi:hypothetical protein
VCSFERNSRLHSICSIRPIHAHDPLQTPADANSLPQSGHTVTRALRHLVSIGHRLHIVYEAGACGFTCNATSPHWVGIARWWSRLRSRGPPGTGQDRPERRDEARAPSRVRNSRLFVCPTAPTRPCAKGPSEGRPDRSLPSTPSGVAKVESTFPQRRELRNLEFVEISWRFQDAIPSPANASASKVVIGSASAHPNRRTP